MRLATELGAHRLGLRPGEARSGREVFRELATLRLIPADLGRRLEGWAGLGEVLGSGTVALGARRLREILLGELQDLDDARQLGRSGRR